MALDRRRIQKPARKLRKLLKTMPSLPTPEDVHSFRTNARRLETILNTLPVKVGRKLSKKVATMRRRAGKVRDLDVLTDYVSATRPDRSERECSVRLLEYLGGQRAKQISRFHNLRRHHSADLRRRLKRTSKTIKNYFPSKGQGNLDGKPISAAVSGMALTLLSELTKPSQLRRSNLHEYRLKIKELRSLLQLAEHSDGKQFVARLGKVKDAIGEWHDWDVLAAIADEALDHGKNCRLVATLRKTATSKFGIALHLAERMRREELRMIKRHARSASMFRLPQPAEQVWSATVALSR
jgi:CHAD domain-containing protein